MEILNSITWDGFRFQWMQKVQLQFLFFVVVCLVCVRSLDFCEQFKNSAKVFWALCCVEKKCYAMPFSIGIECSYAWTGEITKSKFDFRCAHTNRFIVLDLIRNWIRKKKNIQTNNFRTWKRLWYKWIEIASTAWICKAFDSISSHAAK